MMHDHLVPRARDPAHHCQRIGGLRAIEIVPRRSHEKYKYTCEGVLDQRDARCAIGIMDDQLGTQDAFDTIADQR